MVTKIQGKKQLKYVIVSPRNNGGGAIVLHALCKYLCELGYNSKIFYIGYFNRPNSLFFWYKWIVFLIKDLWMIYTASAFSRLFPKKYVNYTDIPIKGLKRKYLPIVDDNTIVVYPEIAKGNFLNAKKVVRWLLYYNTYKDDEINKDTDLFVCYRHEFNDKKLNPKEITLYCPYFNLELYKQTNFNERSGTCYIIRKGRSRKDLPQKINGIVIDEMLEKEKVKILNKSKYCISYDTQTAYSSIAALCGCISIIMPEPDKVIKDYRNEYDKWYGVAIGLAEEQISYAIKTIELLKNEQKLLNKNSKENVKKFAVYCKENFCK